jgi:glutaconate CoA-transferase subunit A
MSRKVVPLRSAIAELVQPGANVAIGGWGVANVPMALIRELIRQKIQLGCVMGNCLGVDMLASAGLGSRYLTGLMGTYLHGPFPSLLRLRNEGTPVEVVDASYLGMGFMAAALGMAHYLLPESWHSSAYVTESDSWRHVMLPNGKEVLAVPPIQPDVALVHCQEADVAGSGLFRGSVFHDFWMAMAAKTVIIQVETVLEGGPMARGGIGQLPAHVVDAVVEVPMGCHPCSSHRYYNHDDLHIRAYLRAASSTEGAVEYLEVFVHSVEDDLSYQARVREPWAI